MHDPHRILGEDGLVQTYLAPLAAGYPGAFALTDDCAVIAPRPGFDLVVKTDPIAAGVHFFAADDPADIGWKALAVNVSDLAAKGARPLVYLLALSFPEAPTHAWMKALAAGLREAQDAFGMHLIGGDTDRRPGPVSITPTVMGEVPSGRMVRRGTARAGDLLYVSGTLGDAALGLALRRAAGQARAWGLSEADTGSLATRYLRPRPRLALSSALLEHARAAMDLSDGLAKDLGRMCRASGVAASARVELVPLSGAASAALTVDPGVIGSVLAGGDDYEVLAAIPPEHATAFETASAASGVRVTRIGHVLAGDGVTIVGRDGNPLSLARAGYDHFG